MDKILRRLSICFVFIFTLGFMVSCGGSSTTKEVTMSTDDLYDKSVNGIELPMLQKASTSELEALTGITSSDYEEATLYLSMINVKATEIGIFKFSSKEQEEAINKGIEKRLKDLEATWSTYLPDQYDLVKKVKKFTHGNVKGYIIADDADKIYTNLSKEIK